MTPETFREVALSFPGAEESGPSSRPDYSVDGKTFATLFTDQRWAVLRMNEKDQAGFIRDGAVGFEPCKGAWGRKGATVVLLDTAEEDFVFHGLAAAWQHQAPTSLQD